jgi:hypothetical protein
MKRTKWSFYQWSEAHSLAVHFLELALLAYVGYRGRYHPESLPTAGSDTPKMSPGLAAEGHKAIRGRAPKVKPRHCQHGHEPCRLPWLHSDRNRGYLHRPPGQWTEELLPSVLEDGVGTFLLATDNRPTL